MQPENPLNCCFTQPINVASRLVRGRFRWVLILFVVHLLPVSVSAQDDRQPAKQEIARTTKQIVVSSVKPAAKGNAFVVEYGLTRKDFSRITAHLPTIVTAIPVRESLREGIVGEKIVNLRLVGTTPDFGNAHKIQLQQGRFLIEKDRSNLNNVAVIHDRVAQLLFPVENPIGKSIRIGRHDFLVVGIVARSDTKIKTRNPKKGIVENLNVYIPISTMRSRFGDLEVTTKSGTREAEQFELSRIEITFKNIDAVEPAAIIIRRLLKKFHGETDFSVTVSRNHKAR